MSFSRHSFFLVRSRDHLFWILRRANAGFLSGIVAWLFVPALSRVLAQSGTPFIQFSVTGLLGGAFLGAVDGMIEESTPKTIRGGLLGGLGGVLGGIFFASVQVSIDPDYVVWGIFGFWAIGGAAIGLVSSLWEKRPVKILSGLLAGLVGGGTGGALGYMMYANLVQELQPQHWATRRLLEGLSGGLLGVTLWFCLAIAERFVIFKRHPVTEPHAKTCSFCGTKSPLNSWYCGHCGAVLQESAPPAALHLSPYSILERLKEAFKFLSRLSATTGVIAGLVIFIILFPVQKVLAFVALVLSAVFSYCLIIIFSSLAEAIQIYMKDG